MSEDFKDHPVSIAERRAHMKGDARLWSPRDALIWALRAIDDGEIAPDTLAVVYSTDTERGMRLGHASAGCDTIGLVGLLTASVHDVMTDSGQ